MSDISQQIIETARRYTDLYEVVPNAKWSSHVKQNHKELSGDLIACMKKAGWQTSWPYCMAFCKGIWLDCIEPGDKYNKIKKLLTPSVMVSYNNCKKYVTLTPEPGAIFLMQKGNTGNGHAGIVVEVLENSIITIEGNTSPAPTTAEKDREGDGIYEKTRKLNFVASKGLWMRGFIHPDNF